MKNFAKTILEAVSIREVSWDNKKQSYKVGLWEACDKASEKTGLSPRGTQPIYLLLAYAWNDIIDWAYEE